MKITRLTLHREGSLADLPYINGIVGELTAKAKAGGYEPTETDISVNDNHKAYKIELHAERVGNFAQIKGVL